MEIGKLARGIWKNLPQKTVAPKDDWVLRIKRVAG